MTRGNWFVPLSLRHFFEAALTKVKTISLAVFCDNAPLVRTVRWRTVAMADGGEDALDWV